MRAELDARKRDLAAVREKIKNLKKAIKNDSRRFRNLYRSEGDDRFLEELKEREKQFVASIDETRNAIKVFEKARFTNSIKEEATGNEREEASSQNKDLEQIQKLSYLARFVLPDTAVGDLEELYVEVWLPKFGEKRAKRLFRWNVYRSYLSKVGDKTYDLLKLGFIADLLKRIL